MRVPWKSAANGPAGVNIGPVCTFGGTSRSSTLMPLSERTPKQQECDAQALPRYRCRIRQNLVMGTVLLDQVIQTDYGQFDLGWNLPFGFDGDFDRFFSGQLNGLVGAADTSGVYINLARRSGGSQVRIELLESSPGFAADTWEDVVEVSVAVPEGAQPRWASWAGESWGPLTVPAGTYRLRVSARGRDAGRSGEFADGVVDWYLVQFWPAPIEPDAVLQVGSNDATYWHQENGVKR